MKLKYYFSFIAIIIASHVYSQGINNHWLMGCFSWAGPPYGGVKMDFTGGALNINHEYRPLNINCTNGVISDNNGDLLFCSNGLYIANAQYDTMMNGGGLNPAPWTSTRDSFGLSIPQANLIIPFPGDTVKYYLFHETSDDYGATYSSLYLYYSVIDMTLDSGRGAVTQKNIVLLSDTLVAGRLTACKHGNGRDWWLIAHQYNTSLYYKWIITPFGILGPTSQNIGSIRDNYFGQCAFSPDGKRFAYYESYDQDLDIMNFNRCTGNFDSLVHVNINDSAVAGGVAFSPNSQVLYVSSMNYVYQFNLDTSNIASTQNTVAVYDGFYSPQPPQSTTFYLSQLAPDGKIYINCGNSTLDIHVINYPDSLGLSCDLQQHNVHLQRYNYATIPNHPNYFLGEWVGSGCDTLTGVQDLKSGVHNIKVFPNPVTDNGFSISYLLLQNKNGVLEIFNILGEKVFSENLAAWSTVHRVNAAAFSPGLYVLRITSGGVSAAVKFVQE